MHLTDHTWKLSTPRLMLHPYPQDAVDAFHALNTDSQVRKYLWDDTCISREQAADILQQNARQFAQEKCGLWQICHRQYTEEIGYAGLWYFFDEPQPQLLYVLHPAYTGNGYATEAARAVLAYAFFSLHFTYLDASCDRDHQASRAVIERLGMQLTGEKMIDGKPTVFYRVRP